MMIRWIKNALILPMTEESVVEQRYFLGAVAIQGNRIVFVGRTAEAIAQFESDHVSELEVIDGTGMLLMPGLINLHNHVSMTLMRGYADDMSLMPWLTEKIWPFEAKMQGDDIYWGAELGIAEMLLGGTTTFVDMYASADRVAEAAIRSGIRAVVCPFFVESSFEGYMEQTEQLIQQYHGASDDRIRIWISPHAPYSCSPDQIRQTLALCAKYDLGLHVHLSETISETETIRSRYGCTPTEFLRDLGVFDYPTLAAHCIHLTESDMQILKQYGVCVSHNPQSNMKLASGVAPVARLLEQGITVGIGTDGPSSNNDLDLWDEMRTASLLQKVWTGDPCTLPAYEVLRMATVYGAKALGMEGELGVITEGARADLILVDLQKPHLTPCYDLIANLVYCAKSTDVDTVFVDGCMLVRHGVLVGSDLVMIRQQVDRCLAELARR